MKTLLLLLLATTSKFAFSQSNRWMYLTQSADKQIYLVDTLSDDIKEFSFYDNHKSIVVIWTIFYKNQKNKYGAVERFRTVNKIAVDTTNNQLAIKSRTDYKNSNVVKQVDGDFLNWSDVMPDTMAEDLIKYVKSLHDKKLSHFFKLNGHIYSRLSDYNYFGK